MYDTSSFGTPVFTAAAALRRDWEAHDADHPLAHHTTNVVITPDGEDRARVRSKGIGVGYNHRVGSVTYDDVVVKVGGAWKVAKRVADPAPVTRASRQGGASTAGKRINRASHHRSRLSCATARHRRPGMRHVRRPRIAEALSYRRMVPGQTMAHDAPTGNFAAAKGLVDRARPSCSIC